LLAAKLIPDPFYADNELHLSWIHQSDWLYETYFNLPGEVDPAKPLFLVFDGLDTIAEIVLNEQPLAKTDNMFRQYRFSVSEALKPENNHLQIFFSSPTTAGQKQEQEHGKLPSARHSERAY
ncbi:glycoside hydrolase family 2 protein, partial [Candidatus Saccharibacteria bacterium]|nr:glycoside hydrolase family 2 protein [Calditrichia bacterium]NIW00187.1 glycoside hydrolase family 2 protein [Candidatus Saccharibacteria bacterium]NIW80538.1 glycoside hydrolase family 2 protein [Calditrichia bacterium]